MNDYGQVHLHSPMALRVECLELLLHESLVPIKVDSNLAYSHIRVAGKLAFDTCQCSPIVAVYFGGMKSHSHRRAVAERIVQAVHRLDGGEVDVWQQHVAHAAVEGALHHFGAVGIEFLKIYVGVSVNHLAEWRGIICRA